MKEIIIRFIGYVLFIVGIFTACAIIKKGYRNNSSKNPDRDPKEISAIMEFGSVKFDLIPISMTKFPTIVAEIIPRNMYKTLLLLISGPIVYTRITGMNASINPIRYK